MKRRRKTESVDLVRVILYSWPSSIQSVSISGNNWGSKSVVALNHLNGHIIGILPRIGIRKLYGLECSIT